MKLERYIILYYIIRYGENQDKTFPTGGIGRFSSELVIKGERDENGWCKGDAFVAGGFRFNRNVLRVQIIGEVKKHKVPFNRKKKTLTINGNSIKARQRYSYQKATVVWSDPVDGCNNSP